MKWAPQFESEIPTNTENHQCWPTPLVALNVMPKSPFARGGAPNPCIHCYLMLIEALALCYISVAGIPPSNVIASEAAKILFRSGRTSLIPSLKRLSIKLTSRAAVMPLPKQIAVNRSEAKVVLISALKIN
uniref:Uncharacterized protein n=1 Tax=Glossina austeni TaxID=7395 RepID=A0A1A9V1K7_GLOAU